MAALYRTNIYYWPESLQNLLRPSEWPITLPAAAVPELGRCVLGFKRFWLCGAGRQALENGTMPQI